jgi:hypothetical protein
MRHARTIGTTRTRVYAGLLALVVKINGIPVVYSAAYRADPLEAAVDVWGFAFPLVQFVEVGDGRDAFGGQQSLAQEGARAMLADADAVVRGITTGPQAFEDARARLEGRASRHPIEHALASRPSVAAFMVELRREERDAFVAVGAVSDTCSSCSRPPRSA